MNNMLRFVSLYIVVMSMLNPLEKICSKNFNHGRDSYAMCSFNMARFSQLYYCHTMVERVHWALQRPMTPQERRPPA